MFELLMPLGGVIIDQIQAAQDRRNARRKAASDMILQQAQKTGGSTYALQGANVDAGINRDRRAQQMQMLKSLIGSYGQVGSKMAQAGGGGGRAPSPLAQDYANNPAVTSSAMRPMPRPQPPPMQQPMGWQDFDQEYGQWIY